MNTIMNRVAGGRLLAVLLVLAMSACGFWAFRSLPVDAFPDTSPSLVQVYTVADGLAPEEVELYVTAPLERAMAGLPRVAEMRSISNFGLSIVNIYFEDGTDIYFARQVVSERLATASEEMDEGFGEPRMGPISTGLGIVVYYSLIDESGTRDLVEMREIQDWMVKIPLQSVPGVAEVLSLGGYEKEYQILIEPQALLRHGLGLSDVEQAVRGGSRTVGADVVDIGAEQYVVRAVGLARSLGDLGEIVLRAEDGAPVRVRDIARLQIGGGPRQGLATADGEGEVVAGLVLKLYGANTAEVVDAVRARFDQINAALPDGVSAVPYYDQGELVTQASATVATALWQGALLVAIVIVVFLGGWRPSLVVALSIPFSAGFAFIAMRVLGMSADLMSLGGVAIAIGMMVDGAIVIAENVDRMLKERPGASRRDAVATAASEVIGPLLAAVSVVIVVFLPIFALDGPAGKTFGPLAAAAALAMAGSLVYAALVAPALACGLMRPGRVSGEGGGWIGRLVSGAAALFVRRRAMAVGLALVMLAAGGAVLPRLGSEFTPVLEEGDILIRATMAPSISLTEAEAVISRLERRILEDFPEVERAVARVGRGEIGAHADPVNSAEIFIGLRPSSEWRGGMTAADLRGRLSEDLSDFPGVMVNVSQPIAMSLDELVTGTRAQLAVKIYGPDPDVLLSVSERMTAMLNGIRGAADVQADQITGSPQLRIELDRRALARHGLSVEAALSLVGTAVGGQEAGAVFEGERRFPVVLRYPGTRRSDPEAIGALTLRAPSGALVRLEQIADIGTHVGPRQITRENGERFIAVQANVRGRDIGSFVREGQGVLARGLDLPAGYRVAWGGQFELQQQVNRRFAVVIPVTLGIVALILLLAFGRVRSALLILMNIPLALTGGAFALWMAGLPLSVPATVGFIALFGIALGNGMVLVSFLDRFAREGRDPDTLAVEGAALRARPVLMTALTTALGLAPLLFATGVGAEVQRPLAVVVFGGLVSSTLLTLLVLPALHRWFAPRPDAASSPSGTEAKP
ncbi:efflux RND transporter permease subunit [Glycocaulis profundi]|nr:efflux RND transporter permease subunit [Glycocaulis profundi]